MILVAAYLLAALTANLIVTHFGPWALPITAWVIIPFDLVARDALHDRWKGDKVLLRMSVLVFAGSAISFAANSAAFWVALASFLAFSAAGATNTGVYALMIDRPRLIRINTSNFFAAISDSIVFPSVAFGMYDLTLSAAQAGSKFAGGIAWSIAYVWWLRRRSVV